MTSDTSALDTLTTALKQLLQVEDADGHRLLYQESEDGNHSYCRVCEEVDGHKAGCAVETAEKALRLVNS